MLTVILFLTLMPLAVLVIGFFEIKLPLVSEHPEMHLITLVKEHIIQLLHLHSHEAETGKVITA